MRHDTEPRPTGPDEDVMASLGNLLATPCDCDEAWTGRGRHATACRWQFIHDFLADDEIAAILAALRSAS